MAVHTMTKGFGMKIEKSLTKGQIVELCKDLEDHFGPGNRFEPLRGKGLLWADWPGKKQDALGSKEMRLTLYSYKRVYDRHVVWPVIEPGVDARKLWEDDPSLAVMKGGYSTQIVAYGDVPGWTGMELELVRECLMHLGIQVSGVKCIRRLRYKPDAYDRVLRRKPNGRPERGY